MQNTPGWQRYKPGLGLDALHGPRLAHPRRLHNRRRLTNDYY